MESWRNLRGGKWNYFQRWVIRLSLPYYYCSVVVVRGTQERVFLVPGASIRLGDEVEGHVCFLPPSHTKGGTIVIFSEKAS